MMYEITSSPKVFVIPNRWGPLMDSFLVLGGFFYHLLR